MGVLDKFLDAIKLNDDYDDDDDEEEEEETVSLKSVVERAEYAAIERAIEKYGSIRKAAAALDVNPSTITRKMQLYKDMSSRKQNK